MIKFSCQDMLPDNVLLAPAVVETVDGVALTVLANIPERGKVTEGVTVLTICIVPVVKRTWEGRIPGLAAVLPKLLIV
jgi:hypothetical protein